MTKYVALLRGVNIGGNNKVEMSRLKELFSSLGFSDVVTYLNSGNVLFSDTSKSIKKITEKIEKEIWKELKLEIRVMVRDAESIQQTLDSIPVSWAGESGMRPHIAFLWEEVDSPALLNQRGLNLNAENVKYIPGALVWNADLKNWSKDTVYRFANSKISKQTTVRSINTVQKLAVLMAQTF